MADGGIQLSDFTNPNSMITPGAAGAITMGITNVLTSDFGFLPGNWTALLLSFLFGSLTFAYGARFVAALGYFVINSLIIFVMAHGSNTIGVAATRSAAAAPIAEYVTPSAVKSTNASQVSLAVFIDEPPGRTSLDRARSGNLILVQAVGTDKNESTKKGGFFKEWSWSGK